MRTTRQVLAALIAIAFVVITVSGLVLAFPGLLLPVSAISFFTWHSVHEWTALVFAVVVVIHLVVNRRQLRLLFSARDRKGGPESLPPPKAAEAPPASDLAAPPPTPAGQRPSNLSRRRFLLLGGIAAAGTLVALTVERTRPRGAPARSEGRADFPVLNAVPGPAAMSAADWVLQIDGLVGHPQRFDRAAWLALPRAAEVRDFRCVQGWGADDLSWEGVRVAEVLRRAGPSQEGKFVTFHAYGGTYTDTLTMVQALEPETLLADYLDGEPLPAGHGGPLRLVIPSQVGYKNVKWVVRLEVTAERAEGYWQRNGYPAEAPVS